MFTASPVQKSGLWGRVEECRALDRLLSAAAGHQGTAVLFHGEPGSGRSSLLHEAVRRIRLRRWHLLISAGVADEATLPYAGLHRLLDPVRDQVAALADRHRLLLRAVLAGDGCPPQRRLALAIAVRELLTMVAADGVLLYAFDDLDLGDPGTAEVLTAVARRLAGRPVAGVLTGTCGVAGVPGHRLGPLDDDQSRAVLADRLPVPVPRHVLTALVTAGGGNPQALVDLAAALGPGQLRGDEPVPDLLPADGGLGRAYRARLANLPDRTRRLLLVAALDERPDQQLLARAAAATGTGVGDLAPAEHAGLVRVDGETVTFPQRLARAMIVATAPLAERHAGHQLLAGLLDRPEHRLRRAVHLADATTGPAPDLADELERAAFAGGEDRASAAYALHRAARLGPEPARSARLVAAAGFAWAAGQPARARQFLRDLPGSTNPLALAGREAAAGRADLLRAEIELRCGAPTRALPDLLAAAHRLAPYDRASAVAALSGAGEAIGYLGDQYRYVDLARRAEALTRADDPPEVEVMAAQLVATAATLSGAHDHAVPALRRAVDLGIRLTGPQRTPAALNCAAAAAHLLAADREAHRLADDAVEVARGRGEHSGLPRALELRACAEYWLGRHGAAAASARDGLRTARSTGQQNWAAIHLGLLAVLSAVRADRAGCLDRIRELGELTEGPDPGSRPQALAQWALAVLELTAGHAEPALARLLSLAHPGTGRGQVLVQVMAAPYLIEAAAQLPGQRRTARNVLAVFDAWAASTANPVRRALSARCHALLAPRGGESAQDWYRTALRLHPVGAATFERARTELLFGRELRRSRHPRAAREHLHWAHDTFFGLGLTDWADQAAAELRAAGELRVPGELRAAGLLTGQQLRVAELVVEGATNREIARRLFLSTRTVDHHLRNVYVRLGIRSRTELVRALTVPARPAPA
ncbi:LuxR family transcriptional regulator [Solwaraspora sp. WMMD792]|uniref:LuxR C-terminal-related transcriptional regulator n=1 Tax=Solwaraspora sp. WMMD792 TaxID=3016099 RepID=UPI0024167AB6|nr:LuxR family transcriptional regulator [Solwaraspora sp. WMMD792]MDG4769877.1 LuxR C-terminal-related transcriptional regulator [Solwaraspora sp. WMMD792]